MASFMHPPQGFKVPHLAAGGIQVKDASGGPAGGQPFKKVAKQVFLKKNLGTTSSLKQM